MEDFSKEFERDFKGIWIPREIWFSKMSWIEKMLLMEVDSLSKTNGGCFASNEFLAKFIDVSVERASGIISSLKKRGYIEQVSFDGRSRVLRSCFYIKDGKLLSLKTDS